MQILDIIYFIQGMDYFAIFLLTFISAVLVIFPVPYFPILITAILVTNLDPNIIAIVGAIGAVLAKSIIYMISYYGSNIKKISKKFDPKDYPVTMRTFKKYGAITIFIASITPIPDNIIFIPFGIYRYNPLKFIFIITLSKIFLNEIVVWSTILMGKPIIGNFTNTNLDLNIIIPTVIISIILIIIIIIILMIINWPLLIEKFLVKMSSIKGNNNKKTKN